MKLKICEKATVDAFEKEDWMFPKSLESENGYHELQKKLFDICTSIESNKRSDLAQNIGLVAHLLGMGLQFEEIGCTYKPLVQWGDGSRSLSPDDLTEIHLKVLRNVIPRTENIAIKARIADILWIKEKPSKKIDAELAIQNYVKLAAQIRTNDRPKMLQASHYLKRAIQLWQQLGRDSKTRLIIEAEVENCMTLENPEPSNAIRLFFFKLVSNILNPKDLKKWITLGEKFFTETMSQNNFEKAKSYTEAMRSIYKACNDEEGATLMTERRTDLFVKEAREMRAAKAEPLILQNLYNKAIETCRNTKGKSQLAKDLHNELLEIQTEIPGNLQPIMESVDLQPAIEQTINLIREKNFNDALKIIALKSVPEKKEILFKDAAKLMKDFPFQSLIPMVLLDEKGKVVAQRPGIGSTTEEQQAAIRSQASQNLLIYFEIKGALIGWAQQELNNRTDYDENIFDSILYPNPFIPSSRIYQFRRGLVCGLKGDWVSSTSILVPQLENSLRTVMQAAGHNMTKIDDGIQSEKGLNSFIYDPELATLIGQDMQFQLQVLLCDKTGLNLRNQVAHGLLTDGTAYSGASPFLWSLSLLLCYSFQDRYYNRKVLPNMES